MREKSKYVRNHLIHFKHSALRTIAVLLVLLLALTGLPGNLQMNCDGVQAANTETTKSVKKQASEKLTPEDVIGIWGGEYAGIAEGELIWRHLKIDITKCSKDGIMEGIAIIAPSLKQSSVYDENGSYYFKGRVNFDTNAFYMEGTQWIMYPDVEGNHIMFPFEGTIDLKTIEGFVNNTSSQTFLLSRYDKETTDIKIPNDAVSFNGNKYYLFEYGLEWGGAKDYCELQGGHLATITSQEEQNIINSMLEKGTKNNYWLA